MKKIWKIVELLPAATWLSVVVGSTALAFAMVWDWAKNEAKNLTK